MTNAPSTTLADLDSGDIRHICAFFNDDDELYRVLLPFIKSGFDRGDKALHVVNPARADLHTRRLASAGIDTADAERRGQLEVRSNSETYLENGRFDPDRMLAMFESVASGNAQQSFSRSRIVCQMDWVADERIAAEPVIEFESRVNSVWRRHDDIVICTYRLDQFRGDAVIDILRTHPAVIIGGTLQRNPFFVPPERFLPLLRERRAEHVTRRGGM